MGIELLAMSAKGYDILEVFGEAFLLPLAVVIVFYVIISKVTGSWY